MQLLHPGTIGARHQDHHDLSFASPDGWLDLPHPESTGGVASLMLFGHPSEGPFAVLASTTPTDLEPPRVPAHGHESDTWRISVLGGSPMGNEMYGPGEFRWQAGGRPYGADGYASGPEGGYTFVMFGNRRGFPTQPVKAEFAQQFAERDGALASAFGIDISSFPDDARGVRTTLGTLDKAGKVNGAHHGAGAWTATAPGLQTSAGVLGHQTVGPLVVQAHAEPGVAVLDALTVDTEVLLMVVAGSCSVGDRSYTRGDLRLQDAGAALPPIVAGDDGLDVCIVVGDRSAIGDDASLLTQVQRELVAPQS